MSAFATAFCWGAGLVFGVCAACIGLVVVLGAIGALLSPSGEERGRHG